MLKMKNIPEIGVGILGYGFMGKSHSNAYKKMPYIFWPPPAIPKLVAICGRDEQKVKEAAENFGYLRCYTEWEKMLRDEKVELFDNSGPNNIHAEPCILAAELGKHILCEKPMAMNAEEGRRMLRAVEKVGVKHMVGFNYRFAPAILLARKLIEEGTIGKVYHFHAKYYQEWLINPNFPYVWRVDKKIAGTGAIGDLGSHVIDLAHFLIGDLRNVIASVKTFMTERPMAINVKERKKVEVDDAFEALIDFKNRATGTITCSRFCAGRKNFLFLEVYGSEGSIIFNLEDMNRLKVHLRNHEPKDLEPSFHDVMVTEDFHPFIKYWWPPGHIIGWEHLQVHEVYHFIDAIINDKDVAPYGATFLDGYKCAVVCDAILESAIEGRKIPVNY
jgi:predicted dehydrogenase